MKKYTFLLYLLVSVIVNAQEIKIDTEKSPIKKTSSRLFQIGIGKSFVSIADNNYKDTYKKGIFEGMTFNLALGKSFSLDRETDHWYINSTLNANQHINSFANNKTIADIVNKTELVNSGYPNLKVSKLNVFEMLLAGHIEKRFGEVINPYSPLEERYYMGIGAYAGTQFLSTSQKYKHNGNVYNTSTRGNYNKNHWVYGVSSYVGYDMFVLKLSYNLSPLFKKSFAEQHLFSTSFIINLN